MQFLRQATASQEVLIGPFVDDTDFKTAETGLTINASDVQIWKHGSTSEVNKNSGGATHVASGRYYTILDATDSDTVGMLELNIAVSGALPVKWKGYVLEEAIYDAMFGASAAGYQVPIWSSSSATVNLSGTTVKTVTDAVAFPSSASINITGNITGNLSGSVGSVTSGVTVTTNNDKTGYSLTATTGLGNQTANITGNLSGSVGSVTGAVGSVTGNVGGNVVGSVASVTNQVTANIAQIGGQTASASSPVSFPASVANDSTVAKDATVAKDSTVAKETTLTNRPTLTQIEASTILAKEATVNSQASQTSVDTLASYVDTEVAAIKSVTDKLDSAVELDGATYRFTANALEQAPSSGLDAADVRSAIGLASANLDTQLSAIAVDAIADAVWNEAYAQHTSPGTFGKLMDIIRKSNLSTDGTVTSALTPSALTFSTSLTETTGAHDSKLLLFTSGALTGESRPIDTYLSTNGKVTLQEALTAIPANGAEFVVLPQHIHSTLDIASQIRTVGVAVRATQSDDGTLSLYSGMTYNGTAHGKISFTVVKNYSSASTIKLYIHETDDYTANLLSASATATSSTLIEVTTMTANFSGVTYSGNPAVAELRYSLVATYASGSEVVASGPVFVYRTPPFS